MDKTFKDICIDAIIADSVGKSTTTLCSSYSPIISAIGFTIGKAVGRVARIFKE